MRRWRCFAGVFFVMLAYGELLLYCSTPSGHWAKLDARQSCLSLDQFYDILMQTWACHIRYFENVFKPYMEYCVVFILKRMLLLFT